MQVILLERVENLGNLGDKVNVKSGYGRNFLVPQGKATIATPDNIAIFEARRAELEAKQADITSALEDPDTYAEVGKALHLNRELTAISDQIQQATKAWEAAASNLENLAGPRAG